MQYTGDGVAIRLAGLEIRWYAIFIVTGMILAVMLSAREAKRRGLDPEIVYDFSMWMLPAAIIGARLWYVIFEWHRYAANPISALDIRSGGLAIHGGIIAAVIVGLIFAKRRKVKFLELADICFPYVALAQAIGRWGNFTNNEAFGGPTDLPWALIIDGQKVHPTFLYESIGNVLIFLFLRYYTKKHQKYDGQVAALYMILYGIIRFFIEGLRTDSLWFGPIRVAQLVSVALVVGGVVGWLLIQQRKQKVSVRKPFKG